MKTLLALLLSFQFVYAQAQYKKDWANAPANPLPVDYTLNHFNLWGPVKSKLESIAYMSFNYYFDEKGRVSHYGETVLDKEEYSYDAKGFLIERKSMMATNTFKNNELGFVIEENWKNSSYTGQNIFEYNDKGLFSKQTEITFKNTITRNYMYDNYNRIVKEESSSEGKVFLTKTYTYSKEGNFLKVIETTKSENSEDQILVKYFDSQGNSLGKNTDLEVVKDTYGNLLYLRDKNSQKIYSERAITYYSNSSCYSGNCKNGWGLSKTPDGNYEGFFVNGKREGFGLYTWADGGQYVGSWINDVMEGLGRYQNATTTIFGEFTNNKLNGRGYKVANGKAMIGIFENDVLKEEYTYAANGKSSGCIGGDCESKFGKIILPNGEWFEGFFRSGKMYIGDYKMANGDSYQGMFGPDRTFTGMGRMQTKDGSFYGGMFSKNKLDGKSYFKNPAGTGVLVGEWKLGEFVKPL